VVDEEVKAAIVGELGDDVLDDDGAVDRKKVAEKVFADREKLAFLEALLHPRVAAEYLRWREQLAELPNPPQVCVTEVPLLFETGGQERFDKVVVITAPAKLREQRRRVARDNRDARLLPDREKVKRADFHYVNKGTLEELDAWVEGVMRELTAA
jgi:dephospho-CoA kinase